MTSSKNEPNLRNLNWLNSLCHRKFVSIKINHCQNDKTFKKLNEQKKKIKRSWTFDRREHEKNAWIFDWNQWIIGFFRFKFINQSEFERSKKQMYWIRINFGIFDTLCNFRQLISSFSISGAISTGILPLLILKNEREGKKTHKCYVRLWNTV